VGRSSKKKNQKNSQVLMDMLMDDKFKGLIWSRRKSF
jgi:hypothetical protein